MRNSRSIFPVLAALLTLALAPGTTTAFAGSTNSAGAQLVPPLPDLRSPVQVFRELLVKTPEERQELLSLRPPGMREPLDAKINEYLTLPPEERELRLQATELRFYLMQLMPLPATNRPALIAHIPEPMRTAVETRLETWNLLPPPMQEEVLENEQTVRYFTQLGIANEAQRKAALEAIPADQRVRLEADIARWQSLPEATRSRVFAQFRQYFDLTPAERGNALSQLSGPEREAMANTLEAFRGLTPEQRRICIRSFEKFASMNLVERQQFLKKAEAWQQMTPSERSRWRELVARVPQMPPLPPGMLPPLPPPPLPPLPKSRSGSAPFATNGG